MQPVCVPPDDGSIQRAMAQLEARLSAWTALASEFQASLTRGTDAVQAGAARVAAQEAAPAERSTADNSPAAIEVQPDSSPPAEPKPSVAAEAPSHGAISDRPIEAEPAASTAGKAKAASSSAAPALAPVAWTVPAPPAELPAPAPSPDEALLASLDPPTAEAIRIMRRLDTSNKSLTELVEEYRATAAAPSAPPARKSSWWKRR